MNSTNPKFDAVESIQMSEEALDKIALGWLQKMYPEKEANSRLADMAFDNKIDYVADKTKPVSYTKQITLDSLNYNDVDYIKIDTEGHELKVLQGCEETLKRTHPVIVLEQNDTVVR